MRQTFKQRCEAAGLTPRTSALVLSLLAPEAVLDARALREEGIDVDSMELAITKADAVSQRQFLMALADAKDECPGAFL